MRQGHEAEAFGASQLARTNHISEFGDTISKVREGVHLGLIEEERTLQKRINEAASQQTRVNGTRKTQTIQSNIGQLTAQLELLRRHDPENPTGPMPHLTQTCLTRLSQKSRRKYWSRNDIA